MIMSTDLAQGLVQDFLESSSDCVRVLLDKLSGFKGDVSRDVRFYLFRGKEKREVQFDGGHFFLRTSVEYSNPQLTVEEVQGIIAVRMLEVCGYFFKGRNVGDVGSREITEICELLRKPPSGVVVPFLLNADDVEPDRYSMNPLRSSILESGQSSFPVFSVTAEGLGIDRGFLSKYEGTLISREEIELIDDCLGYGSGSYTDMVDMVKYSQLGELSELFGINLCIPSLRLPLEVLAGEGLGGVVKRIIEGAHESCESIKGVYDFMGRSIKKRTTLLAVPHSPKGFGSKRAARGKLRFEGNSLTEVKVRYRTTRLYPNAIDPEDVSIAEGDDAFTVEGRNLVDYDYSATPTSPQFILYSLASPESACLWHGIGAFGAKELVRSYTSTHVACARGKVFKELVDESKLIARMPVQFNLVPGGVWAHPVHDNIDASIGCVENLEKLVKWGMRVEYLPAIEYVRR